MLETLLIHTILITGVLCLSLCLESRMRSSQAEEQVLEPLHPSRPDAAA